MKLLFLDVETSPNSAYVWSLWNTNIGLSQMIDTSKVLCWAAKWHGEKQVSYSGLDTDDHDVMIGKMYDLMNQADVVCTYNGNRFDIPVLNKEFVLLGMPPPAPSKSLDLFRVVKKQFRFASNKLDHISQQLGLGAKVKHEGFELWVKCMEGEASAWKKMQKYNKQDVVLLEKLYERIKPWIKSHPNHNLYDDVERVCPSCGSNHLTKRGLARTIGGVYQRYQCFGCGSWSQGTKSIKSVEVKGIAS